MNVLSLISQRSDNYYQIQTKRYSIQQCRYSAWQSGGAESGHQLNAALECRPGCPCLGKKERESKVPLASAATAKLVRKS